MSAALLATLAILLLAADSNEIIQNPGFNEDADDNGLPDHWSTTHDRVLWREKVFMGKDYELVSKTPAYVLATQDITLKQGQQYTLTLRCKGEDGGLIGALIVHGETRPVQEMPIIWRAEPATEYEETVRSFVATNSIARLYLYNVAKEEGTVYYDLVHTGYYGGEAASVTGRRAMQRMKDGFYEVYVVPSRMSDMMVQSIKERVEAGAGLLIVEGFGRAKRFTDVNTLEEVGDDHYLRAGIPWDLMPEKILESVQVGQLGKGRVVRMVFPSATSRVWGLMPLENSREAWMSRQFEYWEWWESLLARGVLWAAGREGEARLEQLGNESETACGVGVSPALCSRDGRTTTAQHTLEPSLGLDASAIRLRAVGAPEGASARVIVRSGREIRFDGPDMPIGHTNTFGAGPFNGNDYWKLCTRTARDPAPGPCASATY